MYPYFISLPKYAASSGYHCCAVTTWYELNFPKRSFEVKCVIRMQNNIYSPCVYKLCEAKTELLVSDLTLCLIQSLTGNVTCDCCQRGKLSDKFAYLSVMYVLGSYG